MVGVGEAVSVMLGMGEGVTDSMRTSVGGRVEGKEGGNGWHAAMMIIKMNRHGRCFMQ